MKPLAEYLKEVPLIAILRGVLPDTVNSYAHGIVKAGFPCVEVPLNSPNPLESIRRLASYFNDNALIGAGTVYTVDEVHAVAEAGGGLIVSPNTDVNVIKATLACGMISMPGVFTPTEVKAALDAGARYLKLFPASTGGPDHAKALHAVLPKEAHLVAVGGITLQNIGSFRPYCAAFAIASELFKPGKDCDAVAESARQFVAALAPKL